MIVNTTNRLVIDKRAKQWCLLPYPGYKNGCPMYGTREECPPHAPDIEDFINLKRQCWISYFKFNLYNFALQMKEKHQNWTDKQCRCSRYWQNSEKKKLKNECESFINSKDYLHYTIIPEAMGVHVFQTMANLEIYLKRNPQRIVYKIALIGYKN